jgi:ribosomal protein S18 acetylase RimI-like enzyme
MLELLTATPEDWKIIREIAYNTWPNTFGKVISEEQIQYMLAKIYSEQSLRNQMTNLGHNFILALQDKKPVGFASYELTPLQPSQLIIHKIYLLPECQGMGIGKFLFSRLSEIAKNNNRKQLRLQVFHQNEKAKEFYLKYGFAFVGEKVTKIDDRYTITDFIMDKNL